MDKAQIDALLAAHGGRAQPVASLHVLRAPLSTGRKAKGDASLSAAEQAFLVANAPALATIDLSRWLSRAAPSERPAVLDALFDLACREPLRFEHEIARAPHFALRGAERTELVTRLVGRAPESVIAALSADAGLARADSRADGSSGDAGVAEYAPHPAEVTLSHAAGGGESEAFFDPGDLLGDVDFGSDFLGGGAPEAAANPAGEGDLGSLAAELDGFEGASFLDGGAPGGPSATPVLDALLADLATVRTPRARGAWRRRALESAADPTEDWGPRAAELPSTLRDAVARRAAISTRGDERAALLEWLLRNGARRTRLVELTIGLVALGDAARGARGWLAQSFLPRLLPDAAAWRRHGSNVLDGLLSNNAYSELDEIFAGAVSGGAAIGPGLLVVPGSAARTADLPRALLSAFGAALVARSQAAIEGGRRKEALALAAALSCLGAPPAARAELLALRRKRGARGEIATLLSLAASRARRPGDAVGLEDLVAAVHVLADALGG